LLYQGGHPTNGEIYVLNSTNVTKRLTFSSAGDLTCVVPRRHQDRLRQQPVGQAADLDHERLDRREPDPDHQQDLRRGLSGLGLLSIEGRGDVRIRRPRLRIPS
jgi:hypothetical protein